MWLVPDFAASYGAYSGFFGTPHHVLVRSSERIPSYSTIGLMKE